MFKRKDSKVWWAGFYTKGNNHVRTSTKSADVEEAKKFAHDWYIQKQVQILGGQAPAAKSKSFKTAAEKAQKQYERDAERGARSVQYVHGLKKVWNTLNTLIGNVELASINQTTWFSLKTKLQARQKMSDKTLHQYKNAMVIVLKQAVMRGDLQTMPTFMSDKTGHAADTPRTWFNATEYSKMFRYLRANILTHKKEKTRWIQDAEELKDYVLFVANSGLRKSEVMNVRFCDVEVAKDAGDETEHLKIRNILGKRGRHGVCKTYFGATRAFVRVLEREGLTSKNYKNSELPLFKTYHRDMFRDVLKRAKLHETNDRPPRKRDLASLRSTYICFRIMHGVPVYEIANNCRTSVSMIEKHYARYLNTLDSKNINRNDYKLEETD